MVCKVEKFDRNIKLREKHRKGLWSPEEDEKLRSCVLKYGHGCWSNVPIKAGLQRNGKSCRLRWVNYLRPGLKKGVFTKEEEETVLALHFMLGNKWSQIAQHLPGRTDNEIKNYWHSYLKKKVVKREENENSTKAIPQATISNSGSMDHLPSIATSLETLTTTNVSSQNPKKSSTIYAREQYPPTSDFSNKSIFPKLMFAEWFYSDLIEDKSSRNSSVQDSTLEDRLVNDEGFGKKSDRYDLEINSMDDIISNSHFLLDDQISQDGFGSSISENGLFNDFIMDNDVICDMMGLGD